jgi:Ca2+-binding RTX toxin-like protein
MANINGTGGNDTRYGTAGNDVFHLKGGNDKGFGGGGSDTMYGEDGNDTLNGESGNDFLFGGKGKDNLKGSFGNDQYTGGAGADRFGFELNNTTLAQYDTIWDFKRGQGDKIEIGNLKAQLFDHLDDNNDGALNAADNNVFDDGDGLELDFSGYFGKAIYLNVEHVTELQASDFIT